MEGQRDRYRDPKSGHIDLWFWHPANPQLGNNNSITGEKKYHRMGLFSIQVMAPKWLGIDTFEKKFLRFFLHSSTHSHNSLIQVQIQGGRCQSYLPHIFRIPASDDVHSRSPIPLIHNALHT